MFLLLCLLSNVDIPCGCQGDSGGPPMLEPPTEGGEACQPRKVVGVVSFGYGCRRRGIYTRVSSYLDWITGIIAPNTVPPAVNV